MRKRYVVLGAAVLALAGGAAWYTGVFEPRASAAQAGNGEGAITLADYPDRVYWGDTHLHTDNSVDAFGFGVRLGPEAALRFARGEAVTSTTGQKAQLARPLDFLVIADHTDALGATKRLMNAPRALVRDPTLRRWQKMMRAGGDESIRAVAELITAAADGTVRPRPPSGRPTCARSTCTTSRASSPHLRVSSGLPCPTATISTGW